MTSIDLLVENLLQFPSSWTQDSHYLTRKDGLQIWTGSGLFFYHISNPTTLSLTWWEKWCLSQAIKEWQKRKLRCIIEKANSR